MMKIYKFLSLLGISVAVALTGCLKDKDYEDHKYGIIITDNPAVSFPQSTNVGPVPLSLNSSTSSQSVSTDLSVESIDAAKADINVALTTDTAGFAMAGLTQVPAAAYNVSLAQVIPTGKKTVPVTITFPNTTTLNPTIKYGLALTISTVSSGYKVATNMRRVVLAFSIKNKYDGRYRVTGSYADVQLGPTATSVLPNEVQLITSGPNTVVVNRIINNVLQPGYLFSNAGAGTFYGNWGAIFTFDLATDNLTAVTNSFGQGTNTQARSGAIDPTGTAEGKNKFFSADHSIKAKYFLNQSGVLKARFDELYTYLGPR